MIYAAVYRLRVCDIYEEKQTRSSEKNISVAIQIILIVKLYLLVVGNFDVNAEVSNLSINSNKFKLLNQRD